MKKGMTDEEALRIARIDLHEKYGCPQDQLRSSWRSAFCLAMGSWLVDHCNDIYVAGRVRDLGELDQEMKASMIEYVTEEINGYLRGLPLTLDLNPEDIFTEYERLVQYADQKQI